MKEQKKKSRIYEYFPKYKSFGKNVFFTEDQAEMANRIGTVADTTYCLKNIFHQVNILQRSISQISVTEHGWPMMKHQGPRKNKNKKIIW